jgi:hypothetical protein
MGALLIWLSGASPRILKRCPTERPKYLGIGSAILAAGAISAVIVAFGLRLIIFMPLGVSVFLATSWGLAIVALDRWLVASLGRRSSPWRYFLLAIPRLILGALIGIAISIPLILQIFRSTIDQQVTIIQQQNVAVYLESPPSRGLRMQIDSYERQIAGLDRGFLPLANLKEMASLKRLRNRAIINADAALQKGNTAAYRHFYALWVFDSNKVTAALEKAIQVVGKLRSTAQGKLAADSLEQQRRFAAFTHANATNVGLPIQLQALGNLRRSSTLNAVLLLLFALFTTIQCLPIMVKVLLNLGPENTYEKMVALEEAMLSRAAREDIRRRQAAGDVD